MKAITGRPRYSSVRIRAFGSAASETGLALPVFFAIVSTIVAFVFFGIPGMIGVGFFVASISVATYRAMAKKERRYRATRELWRKIDEAAAKNDLSHPRRYDPTPDFDMITRTRPTPHYILNEDGFVIERIDTRPGRH